MMIIGVCLLALGVVTLILALMVVVASDWNNPQPPQRPTTSGPHEPITLVPERGDFAYRRPK